MKIVGALIIFVSFIAIVYIAIHYLVIDIRLNKENEQQGEENDELKIKIGELDRRVKALEKEKNDDEKRDSTRKDKTSNKYIRRNR